MEPEPHGQNDGADDDQLAADEHRLDAEHLTRRRIRIVMDEHRAERDEHRDCRQKIAEHIGAAIKMRVVDRERISPGVARCQHLADVDEPGAARERSGPGMARRQHMADAFAQVGGRRRRRQKCIPVVAVLLERRQPQHHAWPPTARDLPQGVIGGEPGAVLPALAEIALETPAGGTERR